MSIEAYHAPFSPAGTSQYWGTAAPAAATDGAYQLGDIVWNTVPTSGQPIGWACSVAGSPGTWIAMANYA
jgi:hypothetical protein